LQEKILFGPYDGALGGSDANTQNSAHRYDPVLDASTSAEAQITYYPGQSNQRPAQRRPKARQRSPTISKRPG